MSTKHTPGPWEIRTRTSVGTSDFLVASVYGEDPTCSPDAVSDANSRLISAAPSLLEALQEILAMLERENCSTGYCCCGDSMTSHQAAYSCGHTPVDEGDYYQSKAIEAARAAIAKATGSDT